MTTAIHPGLVETIVNAVSVGVTTGTTYALPARPGVIAWQTSFGSAPSAVSINLEASLDNSNWFTLDSSTATAGELRDVFTSAPYIRASMASVTGGSTFTVKVINKGGLSFVVEAGATAGGVSGNIQYNNGGQFGGFGSWDGTTLDIPGRITQENTWNSGATTFKAILTTITNTASAAASRFLSLATAAAGELWGIRIDGGALWVDTVTGGGAGFVALPQTLEGSRYLCFGEPLTFNNVNNTLTRVATGEIRVCPTTGVNTFSNFISNGQWATFYHISGDNTAAGLRWRHNSGSFDYHSKLTTVGTSALKCEDGSSGFSSLVSLYMRFGAGSPEGVVTAPVGAIYSNTTGGALTSLYVKESGSGNTGWAAK